MPTQQLLAVGTATVLPCDAAIEVDPRHPATHPGFQLAVSQENGVVTEADVRIGLMHRSAEKLFESRDLRQAMLLADRHDWMSALSSEVSVALAAEQALGITPPERAVWTRMLLLEVERIAATLPFLAPVSGSEREPVERLREQVVCALEQITGSRMHPAFTRIGGVAAAVDEVDRDGLRRVLDEVESVLPTVTDAVAARTGELEGLAVIDSETAMGHGIAGPVGRASGVDRDLRRDDPYLSYAKLADLLDVPVHQGGDARARYAALTDQLPIAVRLARAALQRLTDLGEGPIDVPLPKVVRLPEGMTYAAVEGPIGIAGCLLVGAGDKYPWRMKIRSASFATMSAMGGALIGVPMASLVDAVMSFPVVMGDTDR
jgi:NADH-quinone oxidoreductase subunit D